MTWVYFDTIYILDKSYNGSHCSWFRSDFGKWSLKKKLEFVMLEVYVLLLVWLTPWFIFCLFLFLPIVTVSLKDQYFIQNKSRYGETWLYFCRFINISCTTLSSIYRNRQIHIICESISYMNVCKDYHKHIHLDCTFGPKFKPDA